MDKIKDTIKEDQEEKNKKKIIIIIASIIVLLIILFTLILCFKPKYYEVIFDSDGGSIVETVKVKENDKVIKPTDPEKEGFEFAGWYYNEELYDFDTPVKQNMTLKAKWEEGNTVEVEGVKLNVSELTLSPDGTAVLEAILLPENAKEVKLIWSSSDESIAIVDENGNIKALKEGEVTITVKTEDGKYTASCKVTISKNVVKAESVSISGANQVEAGNTIKLTATVKPDNATNKNVIWSSSNPNIARVDASGNVTGLRAGTVTIIVTTVDGGHKATYTVTVKASNTQAPAQQPQQPSTPQPSNPQPQQPTIVPVTGVSINGGSNQVKVGATTQLTANVAPANATNKAVTWSSDNPSIATVNPSTGLVTGVDDGVVTIRVTTADGGYTATYTVTVSSTYVITFKEAPKTATGVMQYTISVTKNGQPFTAYKGITYNGRPAPFSAGQNIPANQINEQVNTAQITVNGVKTTATVVYVH